MRKSVLVIILGLLALPVSAAVMQPVRWNVSSYPEGDGLYEIHVTGEIEKGWHIYDNSDYGDSGLNSTEVKVSGTGVEIVGTPRMISDVKRSYDEYFDMETGICEGTVEIVQEVKAESTATVEVTVVWQSCNDESCLPPDEYSARIEIGEPGTSDSGKSASGIWAIILEAVLWGIAMLLTPCVFPMVPMTVSFFLKGAGNRAQGRFRAMMYGVFIVLLYTLPICVIIGLTRAFGGDAVTADIFNFLATHWLPNILFFIIFMIFAASFFGAFEITLPSRWVNDSDRNSEKQGLAGVFFLALTLVLVSFSCTGPIVGTVLIKSTRGEFWTPMVAMLAFSIAFALPFSLLAFFPSLLKGLKGRGGSWLNSVKVVLGFIEVALGFKFLSTADQTYHWHLLDREVYLAIWITVFSLLGFYLLGKIRLANDDKVEKISVTRLSLAIAVFSFVVYMIPGMWGAPLKALSGYLPPVTTQDFVLDPAQTSGGTTAVYVPGTGRKYSDFLEMPYSIDAFYDYDEAVAYAAKAGKPLFVDFTGHGCVNCREMEARVWSDPRVLKMLREDYVVCALFADDKTVLDKDSWVTDEDGRTLKTLGKINSRFALERFNVNAQPYYVILDPLTQKEKAPSRGYNLDIEAFVSFLESGLKL